MPITCPHCDRKLADTGDLAEPPSFCMYCGQKLRDSSPPRDDDTPDETVDAPTRSFAPAVGDNTADFLAATADPEVPVKALGGYKLVRFIGAGGMGAVYEAEHEATGRRVAVKVLSGRLAANPASVERFRQEGRVASQITHPHCVFVLAADADAGRPFIVMELMPGKTLKDLVDERGVLPVAEAIARALDVIDGLAEAHRLGVIHRDVKPSNCFLTADDRVKVGDFGLSKSLAPSRDGGHLTRSGAFMGTVLFASPEQIRGEPVGYDSDVYAVCATVYYLLTGRAPHQHESITAALAKAVSEPPPPIRPKRPDVPRELERAVLRGLDRDRGRRWQSLDELGDALRGLRPDAQQPARPRSLVLAYVADVILFQFVVVPVDILVQSTVGLDIDANDVLGASWFAIGLSLLYFGLFEGLTGATPGKRLLRLRVTRVGELGPPGVRAGLVRAAVFGLVWVTMTMLPDVFVEGWPGGAAGWLLALGAFVGGLVALLFQVRRTEHGFRGVHDLASGCRVVQRRLPPQRVRLVSRFPSPLDQIQPSKARLPSALGGYRVRGKACDLPDGGEVWLAEDRSLGRSVLVRVLPPGLGDPADVEAPVTRPTRLRVIGHGTFVWESAERAWVAYAAPVGAPLVDVVDPERPLSWAEARPLLEQLVAELQASADDGTAVWRPTVRQVWVEPTGRLQLLDFPLPTATTGPLPPTDPGADDPVRLVREVATLTLEGKPRSDGGRVRAPLPPHAMTILNDLFDRQGSGTGRLETVRQDLARSHDHPAAVTAGMRAAHLSVQGMMLALGLACMFVVSGLMNLMFAVGMVQAESEAAELSKILHDPAQSQAMAARIPAEEDAGEIGHAQAEQLRSALAPDQIAATRASMARMLAHRQAESEEALRGLNRVERAAVAQFSRVWDARAATGRSVDLTYLYYQLLLAESEEVWDEPSGAVLFPFFAVPVVIWPLAWAAFAFAFRGGLSMKLAGIVVVAADGRPAGRLRCAARELLVWAPLTVVLLSALWLQLAVPEWVAVRTALWLLAVLMLPAYVLVALRYPAHPPQDRVTGTYLVPE